MNTKKLSILTVALFALTFAACICECDDSFAVEDVEKTKEPVWGGFTDVDSGYFKVFLKNNTAADIEVKIVVFNPVSGDEADTLIATAPADGAEHEYKLTFSYSSEGTKTVSYKVLNNATGDVYFSEGAFEISVSHSMWKDATTYIAIIIVIIVVVILIYFVMRGRTAKRLEKAPVKSFTELDAERKAKKAGKVAEKKTYSPGEKKKRN